MANFNKVINKFREESFSERDKGFRFERLMQAYLKTTTMYASRFQEVWLWNDFPYRSQFGWQDIGIDLVAHTYEGGYWAVQCKCYTADTYINKPEVDSFIATSGRTFTTNEGTVVGFEERLWISTTNKWGSTAEMTIQNQALPFTRLNLIDLENDEVDWEKLESGLFGKDCRTKQFDIREHQQKAIDKVHEYLKNNDRGKLIMACGTGKTFTSLKIAEKETDNRGLVLFLVPSIALLGQTLRSWCQQATLPIHAICICSDSQVSKAEQKEDEISTNVVDLALPASTDVENIVSQLDYLNRIDRKGMTVVFSTYQSIDVISLAQKELLSRTNGTFGTFDLIVCDEAHRTTGVTLKNSKESAFVRVHDNEYIRGKKRIYMTATPRLYTDEIKRKAEDSDAILCSMDDRNYYGDEIYRIGFGEAVEKGLLTDYKVLILAVGDKDITPALRKAITSENGSIKTEDAPKFVGCINALSKKVLGDEGLIKASDPLPMKRAVAFCSKIEASKDTARIFTDCQDDYIKDLSDADKEGMVDVVAHHVDGKMSATVRDRELMWLKEQPENPMECRMLTNARCLSEGVDVPSLDAVIFVSPKNSQVDVVQSVGRVMRRSEGKKYGYIIIPVIIPEDVEGDEVLEKHANFKVVWTVLNALRAHDDRFNAEVNKIELSKKKPKHIIFGGVAHSDDDSKVTGFEEKESAAQEFARQLSMQFEELQNVFYAKLVTKVGTKRYWELWAKDIAKIAEEHIERIKTLIADEGKHKKAFEQLMRGLRRNINPNLTEQEAVEMLSQHIISQPVFEALFGDYEFTSNNPVSKSMQKMLDLLEDEGKTEEEHEKLQKFYSYVRTTVGDIKDSAGRQRLIVELYDKFFKVASPKTVEKLGIVYTPVEVVDYIIHSVANIIRKEFNRSLSDENVHILDPFTGTGTFITRLLQSSHIRKEDLLRKYNKEIHANEIVLMAYYIASINIENVYHSIMENEEYNSFEGICLTDTFQLGEEASEENMFSEQFPTNSKRVIAQKKKPITVIIGNPPYSIGQKSANDNAQNQTYPTLNRRIEGTYVEESNANLNKSAYDSYIKAFRWASDRINKKDGGIIGFVTNGAWLDANGLDGFRKCLEREFSSIYVFNLRGNQRTSGELSRKEGGKIFGSGSRTPIAITILVKHPNKPTNEKAKIYYRDIGDYLSREDKLRIIKEMGDINHPKMQWKEITPNEHGDWINHRNEMFRLFTPIEPEKKFAKKSESFFETYAIGVATNRDAWVYNFSKHIVGKNVDSMLHFYNEQTIAYQNEIKNNSQLEVEDFITTDPTKISWTRSLRNAVKKNLIYSYQHEKIRIGAYRPYQKQHLYFASELNEAIGLSPKLFPTPNHKNLVICVTGIGASKDFSTIITDCVPDLQLQFNGQCFPLYWYDEKEPDLLDLFNQGIDNKIEKYTRKDGVTDWILTQCRKQYGYKTPITKEDIFYYVYGILHSPDYRSTFEADLKKMLPRLPFVDSKDEFFAFSNAGRQLAELHLNYETIEPYRKCEIEFAPFTNKGDSMNYRVEKMRFGKIDSKTADKSVIYYNTSIAIKNIPSEAYEYVVNGKSAIEWIMERYQVTTDTKSGITNDPNDWAKEHDDEKYIYNLLLRIINVSVQTVEIVKSLPKLKFE
ncbi:MAG: DEAD/DEAH box helicase [Bacteroidaceae bacterium]|nr:DEAD/DEAH box helicase [Bacteroidaceae bacterium]